MLEIMESKSANLWDAGPHPQVVTDRKVTVIWQRVTPSTRRANSTQHPPLLFNLLHPVTPQQGKRRRSLASLFRRPCNISHVISVSPPAAASRSTETTRRHKPIVEPVVACRNFAFFSFSSGCTEAGDKLAPLAQRLTEAEELVCSCTLNRNTQVVK